MNCWKTFNANKEFGLNRIFIMSFLLALLSFIFLYLPFSIIHHATYVEEQGLIPLLLGLILLPACHKLMHILPLILANKRIKIKWKFKKRLFPIFAFKTKSKLSKKISLFAFLAPTLFITLPGIVTSFVFIDYFAYILLFTAVNIGLSFTDFLYVNQLIKAPKQCVC